MLTLAAVRPRALAVGSLVLGVGTALAAIACGEPEGNIAIVLGGETDTLARAPAPTTLVVASVDLNGNEREVARTPLPSTGIDLGERAKNDIAAVRVKGLLPDGTEVVRGGSLFFQWGALEVSRLDVFVQRRHELARLPGEGVVFEAPVTAVVAGRYVLEAKDTSFGLFDLLRNDGLPIANVLPRPARSIATYGTSALVVDEAGATYLDLNDGRTADVLAPAGGTYGEIAGGLTVTADDGTQFVVGATRIGGGPSARVLRLATDGNLTFLSLAAPREGACAAWVTGRGLVVWGGSADAPGGELLATSAAVGAPLAYPPDPVRGCGAVALDGGRLVVAGGARPAAAPFVATVDLACPAACAAAPWPGVADLPRADVTLVADDAVLVVGDGADGNAKAYRASAAELRELPLRVPRRGVRMITSPSIAAAPTTRVRPAVVVGGAAVLEQYID